MLGVGQADKDDADMPGGLVCTSLPCSWRTKALPPADGERQLFSPAELVGIKLTMADLSRPDIVKRVREKLKKRQGGFAARKEKLLMRARAKGVNSKRITLKQLRRLHEGLSLKE